MCHYGKTIRVKVDHTTHRRSDVRDKIQDEILDEILDEIQDEILGSISPVGSGKSIPAQVRDCDDQSSWESTRDTTELSFLRLISKFYQHYDHPKSLSHEKYVH